MKLDRNSSITLHHQSIPLTQPDPRAQQAPSDEDEEKKRQRRERFGNATKADEAAKAKAQRAEAMAELMDPERMKARLERFGAVKPTVGMSDADKKAARAARFSGGGGGGN